MFSLVKRNLLKSYAVFKGGKKGRNDIVQGRIQEFLKGGVVHYQSSLEHQWCGRRVTAPASGAIS